MRLFLLMLFTATSLYAAPPTVVEKPLEDDPNQVVYWQRPPKLPDAESLLAGVRSVLPSIPLDVTAELHSKSKGGTLEKKLLAEIRLDWQPLQSSADYTIQDAFGTYLEKIHVLHHAEEGSSYTYATGDPLVEAEVPDLQQAIQETDITWTDLSLSFLWWPQGETTGFEKIKNRYCYIVDIPNPDPGTSNVAGVRLWIDNKTSLLMQASSFDAAGEERRRLHVKNLQKIKDLWIIKDMEVRSFPSRHKTILRVRTVEPAGQDGSFKK